MMRSILVLSAAALLPYTAATATPTAVDPTNNVTYQGLVRNGIEVFLGIQFGQDTSSVNRFKPPKPLFLEREHQARWQSTPVSKISEDCLNLNIARPSGVDAGAKLPVIVFIYGGGFFTGFNEEQTTAPDGMILESVQNGLPVIHVHMNYRLTIFGFAASKALLGEGSSNAGLRDQRLALEWVRDNIDHFGGDPNTVTIFGQSSGGLAVGMQVVAYGGERPAPFKRAIPESQFLEPGITGNFTRDAMQAVVDLVGCNTTDLQSAETAACLRDLDIATLNNASIAVTSARGDISHNVGDIWLPVVDGDFLPAPPSKLIREGRFANVTVMSAPQAAFPASCSSPLPTRASKHIVLFLSLPSSFLGTASRAAFTCCSPPAPPSRLSLSTPASFTMRMLLHKHNRPLSHHPHHRCRRRRLLPASHAASASQHIYLVACAAAASLTLPNELDLFWSPRTRYPLVTSRTTAAFGMLLGL
ncbi:Alpha/Beta hydrolase protein [Mycena olivaceomarginata]|nr:Alpha/Beta hydrolase protein [Mycena olivaceomarginata]